MTTKPTPLELAVLRDISARKDPWGANIGGSRRVSQAIGRLERKGFLIPGWRPLSNAITDAGREALGKEEP